MIYVIKDKRSGEIYVGPDDIMRNLAPEEEDDYALLYRFPWSGSSLQGLLRPWIIPSIGNHTLYKPDILEVLEEIKESPEPPKVELHGVYNAEEKLKAFEEGIRALISYELLPPITPFPEIDLSWIEYEDDLYSSILNSWPKEYFSLGMTYLELSGHEKKTLKEIYSSKGSKQEEIFLQSGQDLPSELLPPRLRVIRKLGPDTKEIEIPGCLDTSKVYPSQEVDLEGIRKRLYKDFPLGSVWEKSEAREKLDKIEVDFGLSEKIRMADLEKYFELPSIKNKKFKIVRRK